MLNRYLHPTSTKPGAQTTAITSRLSLRPMMQSKQDAVTAIENKNDAIKTSCGATRVDCVAKSNVHPNRPPKLIKFEIHNRGCCTTTCFYCIIVFRQ
nr:Caab027 [Calliteara abietis nucleopolyhedrovirus]